MTPEQRQKQLQLLQMQAKAKAAPAERPIGQRLYDNLIGDPNDGVTSWGESLGTWLNRGGESMTLGLVGDEASAAVTGQLPGRSYEGELARYRGNEADMSTAGKLSADIFGAVAPAFLTGGSSLAGRVGAVMPTNIATRAIGSGGSLAARMARGAAVGAGAGAIQGFAEGENGFGDRAANAGVSAAFGGVIGGAVPFVADKARAGLRNISDWRTGRALSGQLASDLGVSPQAATQLSGAIGGDDAAMMAANIRAAGPDAMLADAGPSVQGALDAAMQRPGAVLRLGMQRIEDRAAKSLSRITSAFDEVLGKPVGADTAQGAIRHGTSGARTAAYEAAYSRPIDYAGPGRKLEAMLPRVPAKAINDANLLMKLDGDTSRQIMAEIADDGTVAFRQMPDVRQWDYIKRALDHAASSGEGQGALGGQTALGRAYQGLSRTIRDTLKEAVPEYGAALDTAADAIKRVQGIETGYSLLRTGTTREAVSDALKGATGPEREAIKQGLRDYLDDTLANVRSVISDPNVDAREAKKAIGELTSRAAREKMSLLLGKDAPTLYAALDEAQKALGLRAAVAQNSKTAARLAYGERAKELAEPGIVGQIASGAPIRAGQRAMQAVFGTSPEAIARRTDRINAEVVGTLTKPGAENALAALGMINRRLAQNPVNALAGQGTYRALTGGGSVLAGRGGNALSGLLGF